MASLETKTNLTPKPPELLQAQVALYAEQQLEKETPGRERELLASLGDVALYPTQPPEYLTYPSPVRIQRVVDEEFKTLVAKGDDLPLFDRGEYTQFLKEPENREAGRVLAGMIGAYDEVAPTIADLGIVGLDLATARSHPNFLAHGGSNMVFQLEVTLDGEPKQLVALFAQSPEDPHIRANVNSRASVLARAKGIQGLEQGVAVSYDPPVLVAEMAPGKDMASLSHKERLAIPEEHWDKLTHTVSEAVEHGLSIDPNSDNFIYDPDSGFTVIDFRQATGNQPASERMDAEQKAVDSFREKVITQEKIERN